MSIYTDGIHLISDKSINELHRFARKIGLKPKWFQNHPKHPHYDLTTNRAKDRAINKGAIEITSRELVKINAHSK